MMSLREKTTCLEERIEKLTEREIFILSMFYPARRFPFDDRRQVFPILRKEMSFHMNREINPETLRQQLKKLERFHLIKKIKRTNPSTYVPYSGETDIITKSIWRQITRRSIFNLGQSYAYRCRLEIE